MSEPTRRRSVRSRIFARIEATARSGGHRCKDHLPGHFQVATMRWWSGARGHHSPRLPQVRT